MTASEFIEKYDLHDSIIDSVSYSEKEACVKMIIDLAFWRQKWFTQNLPETGIMTFVFEGVESFIYPKNAESEQTSILETAYEDGFLRFSIMDDMDDSFYELRIKAGSVRDEKGNEERRKT